MKPQNCTRILRRIKEGKVYFLISETSLDIVIPHENRRENWADRVRVERICEVVSGMMRSDLKVNSFTGKIQKGARKMNEDTGILCDTPGCHSTKITFFKTGNVYTCCGCGKHLNGRDYHNGRSWPTAEELAKNTVDSLSEEAKRWLNEVAQQLNDPDADGYTDNNLARNECVSAGVITQRRGGRIEIPADINDLVYSQGYLSGS